MPFAPAILFVPGALFAPTVLFAPSLLLVAIRLFVPSVVELLASVLFIVESPALLFIVVLTPVVVVPATLPVVELVAPGELPIVQAVPVADAAPMLAPAIPPALAPAAPPPEAPPACAKAEAAKAIEPQATAAINVFFSIAMITLLFCVYYGYVTFWRRGLPSRRPSADNGPPENHFPGRELISRMRSIELCNDGG